MSSAYFSLRGLVLARYKTYRLKPALNSLAHAVRKEGANSRYSTYESGGFVLFYRFPRIINNDAIASVVFCLV